MFSSSRALEGSKISYPVVGKARGRDIETETIPLRWKRNGELGLGEPMRRKAKVVYLVVQRNILCDSRSMTVRELRIARIRRNIGYPVQSLVGIIGVH